MQRPPLWAKQGQVRAQSCTAKGMLPQYRVRQAAGLQNAAGSADWQVAVCAGLLRGIAQRTALSQRWAATPAEIYREEHVVLMSCT